MAKYNGHKNWNHWNVSLWINNDEALHDWAKHYARAYRHKGGRDCAARAMLDEMKEAGLYKTPDGAPYSVSSIRAAMVGM